MLISSGLSINSTSVALEGSSESDTHKIFFNRQPPNLIHTHSTHTSFTHCHTNAPSLQDALCFTILGARTLLGAPGLTTRSKKLLGAKGIATRSKDASRLEAIVCFSA